jgi:hypothetical protein
MTSIYPKIVLSLLLAALPLTAFSEIEKSKLIKQSGVFQTDGNSSSAKIYIGASDDGGVTTAREFIYSKVVSIEGLIEVDSDDVGKAGDIFVVMRKGSAGSKRFYALNESGVWESWGGSLKNLPIAKNVSSLSENEKIEVYSGKIELGQVIFYVGYSTNTENSKPVIHVNGSPQKYISYDPCPSCLIVQPTSYLESHAEYKNPVSLPSFKLKHDGFDPQSWELADFLQNGQQTLVTATLAKSAFDLSSYEVDPHGEIYFFTQSREGGGWVDVTSQLLDDNTGCILPRKTLVADFNNDTKPDVVFTCHGLDFGYSELKERGLPFGEASRILLSQPDGKYINKIVEHEGKFENCFCHGGAAGDIDRDGNIDLLLSDTITGEFTDDGFVRNDDAIGNLHILLGDGNGNFTLRNDLPTSLKNACCYYSSDLFDFNNDGYLDIWASGGVPHGTYNERNLIIYSDHGVFKEEDIVDLPTDGRHTFSVDMLFKDGFVYLGGINIDYSKTNYYYGFAVTKISLDGTSYEVIYEHEGNYRYTCNSLDMTDSWIKWLMINQGFIVPKLQCSGYDLKVPL